MTAKTHDGNRTALLIVDPYKDFMIRRPRGSKPGDNRLGSSDRDPSKVTNQTNQYEATSRTRWDLNPKVASFPCRPMCAALADCSRKTNSAGENMRKSVRPRVSMVRNRLVAAGQFVRSQLRRRRPEIGRSSSSLVAGSSVSFFALLETID